MPSIVAPGPGAIPESQRISNSTCDTSWVTVPSPLTYSTVPPELSRRQALYMSTITTIDLSGSQPSVVDNGSYQRIQGSFDAAVAVGTVPASATLRRTAQQIQIVESDPYNPVTRFTKYFPPAPLPYVCPERLPSNEPLPPATECIPPQRFQGSAAGR